LRHMVSDKWQVRSSVVILLNSHSGWYSCSFRCLDFPCKVLNVRANFIFSSCAHYCILINEHLFWYFSIERPFLRNVDFVLQWKCEDVFVSE
jgi:hypothetical protein